MNLRESRWWVEGNKEALRSSSSRADRIPGIQTILFEDGTSIKSKGRAARKSKSPLGKSRQRGEAYVGEDGVASLSEAKETNDGHGRLLASNSTRNWRVPVESSHRIIAVHLLENCEGNGMNCGTMEGNNVELCRRRSNSRKWHGILNATPRTAKIYHSCQQIVRQDDF